MAWPSFDAFQLSAEEVVRNRMRKIAYLARYGRQSVLQWDGVDLLDFERYYVAVADIVARENELSRKVEDGQ